MTIKPNPIVSETEFNAIFQQMSSLRESLLSISNELNAYENYILKLKTEETNKNKDNKDLPGIEKHHILPRFDSGTDESSNLVLVSLKEHVIAHLFLDSLESSSQTTRLRCFFIPYWRH